MALAFLGALAGLRTVAEVMAEPAFAEYALRFMLREQKPTLPPSRHDIDAYARQLLQRWRNPGIAHELGRVGRNGSDKLQPRLLASLQENLQAGRPAPCTLLAVAAWVCCATRRRRPEDAVEMQDPLAGRLQVLGLAAGGDAARLTNSILEMEDIFGPELPRRSSFRAALTAAVADLQRRGPRAMVAALLAEAPAFDVMEAA
jgi:fructuronate reductase